MNDPGLDLDTAERMIRGEPTGPPGLARLLAAAARPETTRAEGEQAALAAYRAALQPQRRRRRVPTLISVKAALIGLLLLLTGGVAVAATAHHFARSPEDKRPHHTRTPDTSKTFLTHEGPKRFVRRTAKRSTPRPAHAHSQPAQAQNNKPHPDNTPKGKAKGNAQKAPTG
ncbi:hypothetical protein [Actinoallomurus iriomotensis]|uniref:Uncharacterized protein n=1 Tax=Actinoallomurus iriomotensis TaxID=478107 RepID=A0A9W6S4A9_9ACTN|nr:hypothetical protein [Actinoallomurus iriomotensis]GLY88346.1 hypothetical protein Airi02_062750 [Actinoallomurus iriomotensis]